MTRETCNPETLFNSVEYGFSQIAIATPGKMVFISGQVAWDENLNLVGKDNLEEQTQKAIDNLTLAIEAAGGTIENIMMLRIYLVDYQQADGAVISSVLRRNCGNKNPPASTWLNVKGLANPDFLIEIEAQAII